MEERSETTSVTKVNCREGNDVVISLPDFESAVDHEAVNGNLGHNEERADTQTDMFPEEDFVDTSFPSSCRNETKDDVPNSRQYLRVLSEPSIGFRPIASSALKRVVSTTELRTRLVCPKGLLIATEPPKSGGIYRRRSNTDVSTTKVIASLGMTCGRNNNNLSHSDARKYLNLSDSTFEQVRLFFGYRPSFNL